MKGSNTRRAIAALVTIGGVVAILAVNAARQREQTSDAARQWIGEQWDVARDCLVGTPIGRGEGSDAIARRLERRVIEAVADSTARGDARWPARCTPIFASLRADRSVLRADPGDALSQLEVLTPRVLGDPPYDVREIAARARELASAIAVLDRAMPAGAEYRERDHRERDAGMPAEAILASLGCQPPPSSSDTTCSAGDVTHTLTRDEAASLVWTASREGDAPRAPVVVSPAPTGARIVACDPRGVAIAWRDRSTWSGARCTPDGCTAIAPLRAGRDLRLALRGDSLMAVALQRQTDLPLARTLHDGTWSDPVPVGAGALSTTRSAFRIATCHGAFESRDGVRWRAAR